MQRHDQPYDINRLRLFARIGPCTLIRDVDSHNIADTGRALTLDPRGYAAQALRRRLERAALAWVGHVNLSRW